MLMASADATKSAMILLFFIISSRFGCHDCQHITEGIVPIWAKDVQSAFIAEPIFCTASVDCAGGRSVPIDLRPATNEDAEAISVFHPPLRQHSNPGVSSLPQPSSPAELRSSCALTTDVLARLVVGPAIGKTDAGFSLVWAVIIEDAIRLRHRSLKGS
jgi:hypothetical protein